LARKKIVNQTGNESITQKLNYLGLTLEDIPDFIQKRRPLSYRIPKVYDENQYRQYRFVPIRDIQILLTPTNRMDELTEKYRKASPLSDYLDNQTEENTLKHVRFLEMLQQVKIEDIEKVEEEQERLARNLPFKVKFEGNYLWQIYYSEATETYFMLVPTEDTDYSTFFYLLKKQLEGKKNETIFVPISGISYSKEFFKKSEFEDIENYLWLFTKDWPLIYEVFDKQEVMSVQIIGETNVFEKIKSPYKINLENKKQARQFYQCLKAIFILQTELPHDYEFLTTVSKTGELEFIIRQEKISYEKLSTFTKAEYALMEEKQRETIEKKAKAEIRLNNLKELASEQELIYLEKEKQISTFLACKKSFFGKVKYFFKYSKKNNKTKLREEKRGENEEIAEIDHESSSEKVKIKKRMAKSSSKRLKENYTLEELVNKGKEAKESEEELRNIIMDINALKLKTKNMAKKIENATAFIEEIDSHKKSIFEFWKYSNKDEVATLPEGEEEEVGIIKKIERVFDYLEDKERLGKKLDQIQRKTLTKEETDSIFIATTNLLEILNRVKTNTILPKELESNLKEVKVEEAQEKSLTEPEEFDIFGGMIEDSTKTKKIGNQRHRELPKDKFTILDITPKTKTLGYKLSLEKVAKTIKTAMNKITVPGDVVVYKAIPEIKLEKNKINVFNMNPEEEMKQAMKKESNQINLYKLNLKEGSPAIGFTNSIFYENTNKTLPLGMDLSNQMIVDTTKIKKPWRKVRTFRMLAFENEKDDYSPLVDKTVTVYEK
jgi:hypothetical protein